MKEGSCDDGAQPHDLPRWRFTQDGTYQSLAFYKALNTAKYLHAYAVNTSHVKLTVQSGV